MVDIPLPNFEEISRNIITVKNSLGELQGEHNNLAESFLSYQNKMASRINQEKKEKKRKEDEPEIQNDLFSDPDTGAVMDVRDRPAKRRLINKSQYISGVR
jgi:hypothetical protein